MDKNTGMLFFLLQLEETGKLLLKLFLCLVAIVILTVLMVVTLNNEDASAALIIITSLLLALDICLLFVYMFKSLGEFKYPKE
jgi:hypothetical protein